MTGLEVLSGMVLLIRGRSGSRRSPWKTAWIAGRRPKLLNGVQSSPKDQTSTGQHSSCQSRSWQTCPWSVRADQATTKPRCSLRQPHANPSETTYSLGKEIVGARQRDHREVGALP